MEPTARTPRAPLTPLTDSQRQVLRARRWAALAGATAFVAVAVGLAAGGGVKLLNPAFASRGEWIVWGALGLLWLWWLWPSLPRLRRIQRDWRAGLAASVSGRIHSDFGLGFGLIQTAKYTIRLGPLRFAVDAATFRQLHSGDTYRVTYAPHSQTLLEAAPLADLPAPADHPAPPPTSSLEPLTPMELDLLRLIAAGRSNKEIAVARSLSVNTVKVYNSTLFAKLGVSRRTEAVARARELNLL